MELKPVRGTHDILGSDSLKFRKITQQAWEVAQRFGFQEISTPVFEATDVFKRTLGEDSDIVNKEMYTFPDRGGDELTLRPEGTAGIARAFISGGLKNQLPLRFIYSGPMFRYERPQKGRQRQFHQLGIEILGVEGSQADIESISFAWILLKELDLLKKTRLEINSIGQPNERKLFRQKLIEYLKPREGDLSKESQQRLQSNPLRILDSKDSKDQALVAEAPQLKDSLGVESTKKFENICNRLSNLGLEFKENPRLVRGLDYYCDMVFEFKTDLLGAQDAVLSGGRYDPLIEMMGGPATPGVGWAAGMERLSLLLDQGVERPRPVALIPMSADLTDPALKIAHELRLQGYCIEMSYSGNLSKRLKKAHKAGARIALILGGEEWSQGQAALKDLDTGEQKQVTLSNLTEHLN